MIKNIAIVGGSIAGLFSALLLRQQGFKVTVFEKSKTNLSGRGAGIICHDELFHVLNHVGLTTPAAFGLQMSHRTLYSTQGETLRKLDFPQKSASWELTYRFLRAQLPDEHYHLDKSLLDFTQNEDGVSLTFNDGTQHKTDLVIGADGLHSAVRNLLYPSLKPQYAGYIAWRGMVEENMLAPKMRETLMSGLTFCLPKDEQFLGYPVQTGQDEPRYFNYVWYRKVNEAELSALLSDAQGKLYPQGLPPPLLTPENKALFLAAATANLPAFLAEIIHQTAMPFFQQIYDLAVPNMVLGRVLLLGDAAFVARPHVGAGVTKAAQDALSLSQHLLKAQNHAHALYDFEQERLRIGQEIIAKARDLGANLNNSDYVLHQTASLKFLNHGA